MIMFIVGEGRTAESRRVANELGGSYERLTHVELLDTFICGHVLSKRPSTLIVDVSTAGVTSTSDLGVWLRHVVRFGNMRGSLKGQPTFTIDTPNIIVTGDSMQQAFDLRAKLPYAPIINMGPGYVDTRIKVLGVPDTRRSSLIRGSFDHSDAAFLVRMSPDDRELHLSKVSRSDIYVDPIDESASAVRFSPGKATEAALNALVIASEAALSDGSFKYDDQSAHELQAILDKVKSDEAPDA